MAASLTMGEEPALTECIMVVSPMSRGNTVVHFVSMVAPNIPVAPIAPQHGTQPAVETTVALQEIQCIDDDHCNHAHTMTSLPLTPNHF